jgi:hypothetical protein
MRKEQNCKYHILNRLSLIFRNEIKTEITIQAYHQYGVGSRPALQIKKGCTRLAIASDKVYQLLAHGRWFSLGK